MKYTALAAASHSPAGIFLTDWAETLGGSGFQKYGRRRCRLQLLAADVGELYFVLGFGHRIGHAAIFFDLKKHAGQ